MGPAGRGFLVQAELLAELRNRISAFYAAQMRLLDEGRAEQRAGTFALDGVFHQNVDAEPLRGREAIAVAARRRADQVAADGRQRRHWMGMLRVLPSTPGTTRTRYYAAVVGTDRDPMLTTVYASTLAEDILVSRDGDWLVVSRTVSHDGTPS
jgi:bifunctional aromatase (cyclase/dehydratase)